MLYVHWSCTRAIPYYCCDKLISLLGLITLSLSPCIYLSRVANTVENNWSVISSRTWANLKNSSTSKNRSLFVPKTLKAGARSSCRFREEEKIHSVIFIDQKIQIMPRQLIQMNPNSYTRDPQKDRQDRMGWWEIERRQSGSLRMKPTTIRRLTRTSLNWRGCYNNHSRENRTKARSLSQEQN